MKEVIYNFLSLVSKVVLFFKRLAVKIRAWRQLAKLIKSHPGGVFDIMKDPDLPNILYQLDVTDKETD